MIRIRELEATDLAFLREMLYAALDWRADGELPAREWVLAHPQVTIFHEHWGRPGDAGLVAEDAGRPIGAVWYRLFTTAEHGEGFVDEETPELAIAVVEDFRGQGVGRRLLEAMHERARQDGRGAHLAERRSRQSGEAALRSTRVRGLRAGRRR